MKTHSGSDPPVVLVAWTPDTPPLPETAVVVPVVPIVDVCSPVVVDDKPPLVCEKPLVEVVEGVNVVVVVVEVGLELEVDDA